jgi:predicted ATPase
MLGNEKETEKGSRGDQMLTELRLRNFKAWDDERWELPVTLAPVTLFLGANSSGKTSLLQALLLLKQTFASPDRKLDLNLGGQQNDLIDFGVYEDVVHKHEGKRSLGVGFTIQNGPRFECTYAIAGGVPATDQLLFVEGAAEYSVTRQGRGGCLIAAPEYTPKMSGARQDARRAFAPERSLVFSPEALAELGLAAREVQDVSLKIGNEIGGIAYLGPLRQPPRRTYLWSRQTPSNLGDQGQFAVAALLASANARTKPNSEGEGGRGWLVERVSHWMNALGIAESLEMVRQGRSRFFEVVVKTAGQHANIMDVGFGVSQILPFVVLAHFVPRGTIIISEQPEIHLHPLVQSGLADLMSDVSQHRGVQFLVETHSEHLFRRMQTLVAEGKQTPTGCRMYFVEPKRGKATLRELTMDEYGRVKDWPKHFFGDATGEIERQMRKMLERRQKQGSRVSG